MNYESLRHFADSWGLIAMFILFLGLIGWTFRKGAGNHHERAANMIFGEENSDEDLAGENHHDQ